MRFISALSNEPINQYVILASVVISDEKYLIIDKIADMNPPTIMPDKSKIVDEPFLNSFDINTVAKTVNKPITNANTLINADDNPITIASAAPTDAPVLTPNKSGDTNLFLNVSWLRFR